MLYIQIISFVLLIFSSVSSAKFDPKLITFNANDIDSTTKEIIITFIVPEEDFIYKDFIHCSVYEPTVVLSPWKESNKSSDYYDPLFNETKKVFNETFSLTMTATITKWNPEPVHFYCSYYRKSDKKIHHRVFTFSFTQPITTDLSSSDSEEIETIKPIIHYHSSFFDAYINRLNTIIHNGINHFNDYSRVYFYLLIFLIIIFYGISYYCKKGLERYSTLKEILTFSELSLSILATTYIQFHLVSPHLLHTNLTFAWLFTLSFGYLYLKKSTQTLLPALGTFCTCIGIFLIASSFIVLFKAIQF